MKKLIFGLALLLNACGPDRSFEGKNLYGSTTGGFSSTSGYVEPEWPAGDHGTHLNQIIPEGLVWDGYVEFQSSFTPSQLYSRHWFDPTGDDLIDAVLVITTKYNCDNCEKEAEFLENRMVAWRSQGRNVKVIVLLVNTPNNGTVGPVNALNWKSKYYLVNAAVGADPLMTMLPESFFGWPYHTIVDPRTMHVVGTQEGIINDYAAVEKLADFNKP